MKGTAIVAASRQEMAQRASRRRQDAGAAAQRLEQQEIPTVIGWCSSIIVRHTRQLGGAHWDDSEREAHEPVVSRSSDSGEGAVAKCSHAFFGAYATVGRPVGGPTAPPSASLRVPCGARARKASEWFPNPHAGGRLPGRSGLGREQPQPAAIGVPAEGPLQPHLLPAHVQSARERLTSRRPRAAPRRRWSATRRHSVSRTVR